jgi:hypothetical protein
MLGLMGNKGGQAIGFTLRGLSDQLTTSSGIGDMSDIGGSIGDGVSRDGSRCSSGVSLCFINSHLAAHEGEQMAIVRNNNVQEILNGLTTTGTIWSSGGVGKNGSGGGSAATSSANCSQPFECVID